MYISNSFDAEFNDTQRELQQMVRRFTREEIIPKAAEYDRNMKFPHDIHKKGWELGIMTSFVPEKYGKNIDRLDLTTSSLVNFLNVNKCVRWGRARQCRRMHHC
jgi:alkylation response protein AidB-like acyl-CoA dehydrogenase